MLFNYIQKFPILHQKMVEIIQKQKELQETNASRKERNKIGAQKSRLLKYVKILYYKSLDKSSTESLPQESSHSAGTEFSLELDNFYGEFQIDSSLFLTMNSNLSVYAK